MDRKPKTTSVGESTNPKSEKKFNEQSLSMVYNCMHSRDYLADSYRIFRAGMVTAVIFLGRGSDYGVMLNAAGR
jgi:hypothetical protein